MKKELCGDKGSAITKRGGQTVQCQLPAGHEGEHWGKSDTAEIIWWNQERNPQKEVPA